MWDTVQTNEMHLSHDMPCARCRHAVHTFLACGPGCACEPVVMPGTYATATFQATSRPRSALPHEAVDQRPTHAAD